LVATRFEVEKCPVRGEGENDMAVGVVTYVHPVAGLVAPSKAQAAQANEVIADVVFGAGDTVATVVHNLGLSAAGADGRPRISAWTTAAGTALNDVVIAVVDANTVSVTPVLGAANTGLTKRISLQRPQSISR
jgi:hypothetical protein